MRQQIKTYARDGEEFSVISFDADKFKRFNDSFGHDAGDKVLEEIATEMRKSDVEGHIPCRFGGEEFLIVLPNTCTEVAQSVAEDLRARVEALQISYANQILPKVTISCGVATYPHHADGIQELLRVADLALYQAKEEGRNQVRLAADP